MLRISQIRSLLPISQILFLVVGIQACGTHSEAGEGEASSAPTIAIAVAANMQFAMEELTKAFTEESGIRCQTSVSSSGKLTAQIQQGAPFDVFVSANMKYPNEIQNSGLASRPPKVYALGKLVLWSLRDGLEPSLDNLKDPAIRHIALANPKVAPYGMAAEEAMKEHGLLPELQGKLVFGESIAQTNQFITTQSAEVGFTAMSVVLSPTLQGKGQWTPLSASLYSPIEQGVVLINRKGRDNSAAQAFYDFLSSAAAKAILQDFGYEVELWLGLAGSISTIAPNFYIYMGEHLKSLV